MMKNFKQVLIESSIGRVFQHTKNRNIGMISASRAALPAQENHKRHNEMAKDIRKLGYGFIKVKGRYVENYGKPDARPVDEKAFLVVGKKSDDHGALLGHLKHLGAKYNQDSILHKAHNSTDASLHGTNEHGYPGINKSVNVGSWHPNRSGEFYSLLKNRSFNFSEGFVFIRPQSFFSRFEWLY